MMFLGDHLPWVLLALPLLGAAVVGLAPRVAARWVGLATGAAELVLLVLATLLPMLGFPVASVNWSGGAGGAGLTIGLQANLPASGLGLVVGVSLLAWLMLGWEHRVSRRRDVALPLLSTASVMLVVLGNGDVTVAIGAVLSSAVSVLAMKATKETAAATLLGGTQAVAAAGLLVLAAASLRGSEVMPPGLQAVLLVLVVLLRLGYPPVHGGWFAAAGAGNAMARALVVGSGAVSSGVILLRLWPPGVALSSGWALAGAIGMVYGGFVAMGAGSIRHVAAGFHVVAASLLLLAVTLGDPIATALATVTLATVTLATGPTSLLLLGRAIERRVGSDQLASLGGLSQSMPTALMLGIAAVGVSSLLPISAGFVSMLLVSSRAAGQGAAGWTCVALVALSFILLTCAATRLVRRVFFGPRESEPAAASDLRWWEIVSLTLLLVLAIGLGVAPGLVGGS